MAMSKAYEIAHDYKSLRLIGDITGLHPLEARTWAMIFHGKGLVPLALYWMDYKNNVHGKRPIGIGWKELKLDLECLQRFQQSVDRALSEDDHLNIGLLTGQVSDLIVLDLDLEKEPKPGEPRAKSGLDFYRDHIAPRLDREGIMVPFVVSGSGGLHLYFKYSRPGALLGSRNGHKIDGIDYAIDIKSDGCMIVAPPSMHYKAKRPYMSKFGLDGIPDVTERPEMPQWLINILLKGTTTPTEDVADDFEENNPDSEDNTKVELYRNNETSEHRVNKVTELVDLLDPRIANNYESWRNVCLAILRYLDQSDEALEIVQEFSRKSSKYDDETTQSLIRGFITSSEKDKGYSLKTIIGLVQKYNSNGYAAWNLKYPLMPKSSVVTKTLDSKNQDPFRHVSDIEWAEFITKIIKDQVVCFGPVDQLKYLHWDVRDRLWVNVNLKTVMGIVMSNMRRIFIENGLKPDIIKHYTGASYCRLFEYDITRIWAGETFDQPEEMGDWLPLNNGIKVNAMTNQQLLREPEDNFTFALKYNLTTVKPEHTAKIADFFNKLRWGYDDDFLPWFLWLLRFTLTTRMDTDQPSIINLYGITLNCKTTITEALMSLLGPIYGGPLDKRVLYQSDDNGSSHDSHLVTMRGRRVCCYSELGTVKVNSATIKRITGGDRSQPRGAYGSTSDIVTFIPQAKIWIATNLVMNLETTDDATHRRLVYINLNCQFVSNPTREGQFKSDTKFKFWLMSPVGSAALLKYILDNAPKESVEICRQVQEFCQSIRDHTPAGPIELFCQSVIRVSDQAVTLGSDLWNSFKTWCIKREIKPGNPTDFGMEMKRRYQSRKRNGNIVYDLIINRAAINEEV